jgi:uncharacterized lipoprotein
MKQTYATFSAAARSKRLKRAAAAFASLVLTIALTGCLAGYKANLALKAVVEPEELGNNAPVAVMAKDARTNKVVCKNANSLGLSADVTVSESLETQLAQTSDTLLTAKGFTIHKQDPETARRITVELTSLSCQNQKKNHETISTAKASIRIIADNNGHVSERTYQDETTWNLKGDNLDPDYDRLLSQTISKTLARLGVDYDFLNDLAAVKLRSKDLQ